MVHVVPLGDWGNAFTSRRVHPDRLGACGFALRKVGVLSNGEVTICCPDYDGHTSLGNLHISSLGTCFAPQGPRRSAKDSSVCGSPTPTASAAWTAPIP